MACNWLGIFWGPTRGAGAPPGCHTRWQAGTHTLPGVLFSWLRAARVGLTVFADAWLIAVSTSNGSCSRQSTSYGPHQRATQISSQHNLLLGVCQWTLYSMILYNNQMCISLRTKSQWLRVVGAECQPLASQFGQ